MRSCKVPHYNIETVAQVLQQVDVLVLVILIDKPAFVKNSKWSIPVILHRLFSLQKTTINRRKEKLSVSEFNNVYFLLKLVAVKWCGI